MPFLEGGREGPLPSRLARRLDLPEFCKFIEKPYDEWM
jgi:hypothetical protein